MSKVAFRNMMNSVLRKLSKRRSTLDYLKLRAKRLELVVMVIILDSLSRGTLLNVSYFPLGVVVLSMNKVLLVAMTTT